MIRFISFDRKVKLPHGRMVEKAKRGGISRSDFSVTNPEPEKKTVALPTRTGKCVLEDGIDYSMLWEPVAIR